MACLRVMKSLISMDFCADLISTCKYINLCPFYGIFFSQIILLSQTILEQEKKQEQFQITRKSQIKSSFEE